MRSPSTLSAGEARASPGIRHEAWIYDGADEFVSGSLPFVHDALAADEAIMVATTPTNVDRLKHELGAEASAVRLVDITEAGRNPGRILSMWRELVATEAAWGRSARGIGEPVWGDRTPAELDECWRHEALINVAFGRRADFWLLCPYDRGALNEAELASLERTHPYVHDGGVVRAGEGFDSALAEGALEGELPRPTSTAQRFAFDRRRLSEMRTFLRTAAQRAGLGSRRVDDLLVAVTELAANAIRHGGGTGTLAVWREADALLCEVDASGRIEDPLVGRAKPLPHQREGRGLWIVHELCDLVQIRSSDRRSTVRVTLRLA